ncbi:hypothetical protein ACQX0N_09740 [Clostridium tepidum]|uniref:Uncharacterized protein n=1 Tax=Clostridium tepidum TaxID=1962263 RepID=A0ABX3L3B9_9CLOT|nr:hypothetical protein [Clostridium tepidum]OOO62005.1 hypothetical protein BS637_09385 [Clostridium tepidum]
MFKKVKATTRPRPEPPGKQYTDPIIIKTDKYLSITELDQLNKLGIGRVVILPKGMEIIDLDRKEIDYRIFTKDDYKRYTLSRMKASNIKKDTVKFISERWENISKGYNFIIGVGKNELMFYSVSYFNEHVLDEKDETNK